MKRSGVLVFTIFIASIVILLNCGGKKYNKKQVSDSFVEKRREEKRNNYEQQKVTIKSIKILPENPTIKSNIEIQEEIENKNGVPLKIIYKFWVNGKVVKESTENFLTPDDFSKKDYVWCDVEVYGEENGKFLAQKRSRIIRIPSSAPMIRIESFPEMNKFKKYYIKYTVEDPDNKPEEIKMEIVGYKVPKWIKLIPEEQKIEIDLNKNIKPGNYSFKLKAEDIDGAYSEVEFMLLITKNKTIEKKLIKKSIKETKQRRSPQGAPFDFPEYPKIHK